MSIPDIALFGSGILCIIGLMGIVLSIIFMGFDILTNNYERCLAKVTGVFGGLLLASGVFIFLCWGLYIGIRVLLHVAF